MTTRPMCAVDECPSWAAPDSAFCSPSCSRIALLTSQGTVIGQQQPTFLWVPPYRSTSGMEVIDMARSAGLYLDPWQQHLILHAFAEDPNGAWLCFEVAIIVSRQNGKGSILEAVELAWLFLFGEKLVIHSAHLFETSRVHFMRILQLIQNTPDFDRRVKRVREGRGAEEIELLDGAMLKFMTRKGGAGRGFTGSKNVFDEAMYLESTMMAAMLPTLATEPNAQVWYTGSAGMRHSTQLAAVRARGRRRDDPALMFAEWSLSPGPDEPEPDEEPDRSDATSWRRTNPGAGIRISETYIRREARALGGFDSAPFGQERLGIGDYPEDDEAWEVIPKQTWDDLLDPLSGIGPQSRTAYGLDADETLMVGTIVAYGLRPDSLGHVETVARHRGIAWCVDYLVERVTRHKALGVAILPSGAVASLIKPLRDARVPVHCPTDAQYRQACGEFVTDAVERGRMRHLGQASLDTALGGSVKRFNREGGWTWHRTGTDQAPIVGGTLARWELLERVGKGGGFAFSSDELARRQQPDGFGEGGIRARAGAAGYAAAKRGGR
jgi:hypothetical protein